MNLLFIDIDGHLLIHRYLLPFCGAITDISQPGINHYLRCKPIVPPLIQALWGDRDCVIILTTDGRVGIISYSGVIDYIQLPQIKRIIMGDTMDAIDIDNRHHNINDSIRR